MRNKIFFSLLTTLLMTLSAWGSKYVTQWELNSNWSSSRTGGLVSASNGALTAIAGSDNAKRADIKNETNTYTLNQHRVVYYIAKPSAGTQSTSDMKMGYKATVSTFNEKAVVNEQVSKKGSKTLDGDKVLVYFDLWETKPVVAYFSGESGTKFTDEQKTSYNTELNKLNTLDISNVNFTLISSENASFTIYEMGSATSVTALLNHFEGGAVYDVTADWYYSDLNAANSALTEDGHVWEVKGEVSVVDRINIAYNVTIRNKAGVNAVIKHNSNTNMMFLMNAAKTLTIEQNTSGSLTIDGMSSTHTTAKSIVEASHGGTVVLNRVAFRNISSSDNGAVICAKSSSGNGKATITDCTFESVTTTGKGVLAVMYSGSSLTLRGKNTFSACSDNVYLAAGCVLTADNVQHVSPISIKLDTDADRTVVNGCTDVTKFTVIYPERNNYFYAQDGNLLIRGVAIMVPTDYWVSFDLATATPRTANAKSVDIVYNDGTSKSGYYSNTSDGIVYLGTYELKKIKEIKCYLSTVIASDQDTRLSLCVMGYDAEKTVDASYLSTNSAAIRATNVNTNGVLASFRSTQKVGEQEIWKNSAQTLAGDYFLRGVECTMTLAATPTFTINTSEFGTYWTNGLATAQGYNSAASGLGQQGLYNAKYQDGVKVELFVYALGQKGRVGVSDFRIQLEASASALGTLPIVMLNEVTLGTQGSYVPEVLAAMHETNSVDGAPLSSVTLPESAKGQPQYDGALACLRKAGIAIRYSESGDECTNCFSVTF